MSLNTNKNNKSDKHSNNSKTDNKKTGNDHIVNKANSNKTIFYTAIVIAVLGLASIFFSSFQNNITGMQVAQEDRCDPDAIMPQGFVNLKTVDGFELVEKVQGKTSCAIAGTKPANELKSFVVLGERCDINPGTGEITLQTSGGEQKIKATGCANEQLEEAGQGTKLVKSYCAGNNLRINIADCECQNGVCQEFSCYIEDPLGFFNELSQGIFSKDKFEKIVNVCGDNSPELECAWAFNAVKHCDNLNCFVSSIPFGKESCFVEFFNSINCYTYGCPSERVCLQNDAGEHRCVLGADDDGQGEQVNTGDICEELGATLTINNVEHKCVHAGEDLMWTRLLSATTNAECDEPDTNIIAIQDNSLGEGGEGAVYHKCVEINGNLEWRRLQNYLCEIEDQCIPNNGCAEGRCRGKEGAPCQHDLFCMPGLRCPVNVCAAG